MAPPLVTPIEDGDAAEPRLAASSEGGPIAIIFNERTGPGLVAEIITIKHAFVSFEVYEVPDEQGRQAYLLVVDCETASAEQLLELVGSRLPDYIQARRFPPSRIPEVRRTSQRLA